MGNANGSVGGKDDGTKELGLWYKGPVVGRMPEGVDGVILGKHLVLDEGIANEILSCFDSGVQLVKKDDLNEFDIDIPDPNLPDYKPFFFDRGDEYGQKHTYHEALCHALPWAKQIESGTHIHLCSSARYTAPLYVPPAPHSVSALVDAIREINADFLQTLHEALLEHTKPTIATESPTTSSPPPEASEVTQEESGKSIYGDSGKVEGATGGEESLTAEQCQGIIDAAFRNIAIQVHFNGPSQTVEKTLHQDHAHSSLHMGVTLNGSRIVGFKTPSKILEIEMKKGTVYLTTPSAIFHGVATTKLSAKHRSVSIQLRSLLGVSLNSALSPKSHPKRFQKMVTTITKVLGQYENKFRLPTYEEWKARLDARLKELSPVAPGATITFKNRV